MRSPLPPDWRTQNRALRRVYAKYMTWLERFGYVVVALVIGGFVYAFTYAVDETVSADKVKLELAGEPAVFDTPVHVVDTLVDDFGPVKRGQPVFTYTTSSQGAPQVFVAPSDGIFKMSAKPGPDGIVPPGQAVGTVYDPNRIVCKASLAGPSVARATESGELRVSNIVVEPSAGVVLRQSTSGGTVVSSQLLGQDLVKSATAALKGYDLKLRDDQPFAPGDVTELSVEAVGGSVSSARAVDPRAGLTCRAKVLSGRAQAVAQVADLPPDLSAKLREAVAQEMSRQGLQAPDDMRFVLKLKGVPDNGSGTAVPATALTRTFDIDAELVGPPEELLGAVRRALMAGKSVTAKVELKTGSRPLATILLKKS
ncbi:MAG: hypothetical protein KF857_04060 [Fimbriimonadaceae bacterium]|nr:hypothetical protein [Fimbriimonadaceae bacterium]